jgi:hypothetical protein
MWIVASVPGMKPKAGRSRREIAKARPLVVGDLRGDVASLAADVQRALVDDEHLVWADDDHTVFVSRGDPAVVPEHWIIGTYTMGTPYSSIEQDLAHMRHDRAKNWILD